MPKETMLHEFTNSKFTETSFKSHPRKDGFLTKGKWRNIIIQSTMPIGAWDLLTMKFSIVIRHCYFSENSKDNLDNINHIT
jgi:hypothetical protein